MNHDAIYALNPSVVTIDGDIAYDKDGNIVQYDIDAVNAWVNPKQYKTNRQYYFSQNLQIGDQLDMIWHSIDQGLPLDKTSDFYKAIADVKIQFPKE